MVKVLLRLMQHQDQLMASIGVKVIQLVVSKMGQSVNLRTLTLKSVMGFGKHFDMNVSQVLATVNKSYIIWCYYSLSNISFVDEILNMVGITEEYRITKPGKDAEMLKKFDDYRTGNWNDTAKANAKKRAVKILKGQSAHSKGVDRIRYSKASLARKNHGH